VFAAARKILAAQGVTMPIAITCPTCHARAKAPDAAAGRTARCPKCGAAVTVPDQATSGTVNPHTPAVMAHPVGVDQPAEELSEVTRAKRAAGRARSSHVQQRWIWVGIVAVLAALAVGVWGAVQKGRQRAEAETALRQTLDRWVAGEDMWADKSFNDPNVVPLNRKLKPISYRILESNTRLTGSDKTGWHEVCALAV
jgi:hypothetical protein